MTFEYVPPPLGKEERPRVIANARIETVTAVQHWTDSLFSFRTTRSPTFRFQPGEFTMIGLEVDGKPLMRAYSIASPNYEDELEFLSIKVPDGPLTSRLQKIQVGDLVYVGKKPVGTLVTANLLPGRRLYLLSTGTGLAPFLSLVRDPSLYESFETVVLTHTTRKWAEQIFNDAVGFRLRTHEYLGEMVSNQLRVFQSVTRADIPGIRRGRITDLIRNGVLASDLTLPDMNPEEDRVMICGNPQMTLELSQMLQDRGFVMGSASSPGHFVIEKAFVER